MKHFQGYCLCLAGSLALTFGSAANAGEMLTPGATAAGFTLSTFADGFPTTGFCCGPLGIAFPTTGGVMVSDFPGNVRTFATDTDGQHAGDFTPAQNYGSNNGVGLATLNGNVYMTEQAAGKVVQLNNDGTFDQNIISIGVATGISADASNGLLYVSDVSSDIWAVDPVAKTRTAFASGVFDGVTVDTASGLVYAESGGSILGYRISDGTLVFNSGVIPDSPDGVAVGTGSLAGNLFVNTNGGSLWEVNIATMAQMELGSGGSRGDFVTADPNGTLLLTQTDSILRLTAPAGGGFGGAPEPGTIGLMFGGLGAVMFGLRRRARG